MKRLFLIFLLISILAISTRLYSVEEQNQFSYDSNAKRDPMMPLVNSDGLLVQVVTSTSATDMHLQGVVLSGVKDKYAIIDGEIYKENDSIGEYKVLNIGDKSVKVSKGSEEFILEIEKEEE